jgi:hypothetical protein
MELMARAQKERQYQLVPGEKTLSLIDRRVLEQWRQVYGEGYMSEANTYCHPDLPFKDFVDATLQSEVVEITEDNFEALVDLAKKGKDLCLRKRLLKQLKLYFLHLADKPNTPRYEWDTWAGVLKFWALELAKEDADFLQELWDQWEEGTLPGTGRLKATESKPWMDTLMQGVFAQHPLTVHSLNQRVQSLLKRSHPLPLDVTFAPKAHFHFHNVTAGQLAAVKHYDLDLVVSSSVLKPLLSFMPYLRSLRMHIDASTKAGDLKDALSQLAFVERFNVTLEDPLKEEVLQALMEALVRWPLEELSLNAPHQHAQDLAQSLAEKVPQLKFLKRLDLAGIDIPPFKGSLALETIKFHEAASGKLSNQALISLLLTVPDLRTLHVTRLEGGQRDLSALHYWFMRLKIEDLKLPVTDEAWVRALVQVLSAGTDIALKRLDISSCTVNGNLLKELKDLCESAGGLELLKLGYVPDHCFEDLMDFGSGEEQYPIQHFSCWVSPSTLESPYRLERFREQKGLGVQTLELMVEHPDSVVCHFVRGSEMNKPLDQ